MGCSALKTRFTMPQQTKKSCIHDGAAAVTASTGVVGGGDNSNDVDVAAAIGVGISARNTLITKQRTVA